MAVDEKGTPIPPQVSQPAIYDFRHMKTAPKGFKESRKRKLEEREEQVENDEAAIALRGDDEEPSNSQSAKRTKVSVNRVSGKNWKAPSVRMSATKGPVKLRTSWETKMAAKAEAKLFKAQKDAAREETNAKLAAERERRKEVKERKEANKQKALHAVGQKVSTATVKRLMKSKKGRKQLITADTNP